MYVLLFFCIYFLYFAIFFVAQKGKSICLICNKSISVNKEYSLKRHHETKHKSCDEYKPSERKEKLEKLKANLDRKQTIFKKAKHEIATKMKPFTEGEFIEECMMSVVRKVCPEKKGAFENIILSARTVTRRIEKLFVSLLEKHVKEIGNKPSGHLHV